MAREREAERERLYTREALAKHLGICRRSVANMERRGCPVQYPLPCTPRYSLTDVTAWIKSGGGRG